MKSSHPSWLVLALVAVCACGRGSRATPIEGGVVPRADAAAADATLADMALADTPLADAALVDSPDTTPADSGPDVPTPPAAVPKLDVLFMVDNTATNIEEQRALSAALPAFFRRLGAAAGRLPDIHVAVVSSNMGAGTFTFNTCPPLGDRGRFQVRPACGLDPQGPRFLAVDGNGSQNFGGELGKVLACMVLLGAQGCTFAHPLQAVRFALSPGLTPENAGFLRPDAQLAIVLVADEDDCSADPEATFFEGKSYNILCALRGHLCNGDAVPDAPFVAPLASCQPFVRSDDAQGRASRLINVSDFTSFVKGLKPDHPERVLVAAIIGWDDRAEAQYRLAPAENPNSTLLELAPVCPSGYRPPKPALRLKSFADSFGPSGSWFSACPTDLGATMEAIAERIARRSSPAP